MTPKRKDRVAPPPGPDEWDLRYATNDAAKGWEELGRQVPHNLSRAWEALRTNPRPQPATTRQHQLKGKLGTGTFDGREMPCWQYEVTGGAESGTSLTTNVTPCGSRQRALAIRKPLNRTRRTDGCTGPNAACIGTLKPYAGHAPGVCQQHSHVDDGVTDRRPRSADNGP